MAYKQEKTAARGYGAAHVKRRAEAKKQVDAGQANCWRCGRWLPPGEPFDLGHDDDDRTVYRGPECVPCNRSTSGRKPGVPRGRNPDARSRRRGCEICGAWYTASSAEQRTCSRACGWELRRRNAPPKTTRSTYERSCVECEQEFVTTRSRQITCSAECSKLHGKRLSREYYHTNPEYRAATIDRAKSRRWKL